MGGASACIMIVNSPSILSAALLIRRVVFAYGLPVQPVPGDFFRQYSLSPCLIHVRIEQGERINAETPHPPAIDLHLPNIKRLSSYNGLTDQPFRFFPCGWVVRLPGNIDGQRVQPGFLSGDGLDQGGRWFQGLSSGEWQETEHKGQGDHAFHGANLLDLALSEANKQTP